MEHNIESLFMRIVEVMTRAGLADPQHLAEALVHMVHIAAAFFAALAARRGWRGYRRNFKPSTAPLYFASKDLKDREGWLSGLALLPLALIETLVLPLQGLIALFMPRPEVEKAKMDVNERASAKNSARLVRLVDKTEKRAEKVEQKTERNETAIRELLLNYKGMFEALKATRAEIAQASNATAPTKKIVVPGGGLKKVARVRVGRVPDAPWKKNKAGSDV